MNSHIYRDPKLGRHFVKQEWFLYPYWQNQPYKDIGICFFKRLESNCDLSFMRLQNLYKVLKDGKTYAEPDLISFLNSHISLIYHPREYILYVYMYIYTFPNLILSLLLTHKFSKWMKSKAVSGKVLTTYLVTLFAKLVILCIINQIGLNAESNTWHMLQLMTNFCYKHIKFLCHNRGETKSNLPQIEVGTHVFTVHRDISI